MTGFFARHSKTYAAGLAAGLFMAFIGALGTDDQPLGKRLLLWVPMLLFGTVVGQFVGGWTSRRPRIGENAVLTWAVITAAVAAITAVAAWGYVGLIFGWRGPRSLFDFLVPAAVISGTVTAIMMLINRPGPATHAAPPAEANAPAEVRFLERMPEKLKGGAIYAVQAEDHYLRIHTSKGSDLILMRLSDAVAELEGIEGAQTHRSWWVAKDGIAEVRRAGGRVALALKDGAEAPVSRPNVKALRESGWI
jgi:DNA-binding LytR/AlgR family response regulator